MKFILLALLAASGICSAHAAEELALSDKQIQLLGITTMSLPKPGSGEQAGIPAQVVIPANQLLVVSSPLPGMVEQTLVGVGDHVHKGQLLARLQSPALAEVQRGFLQAATQEHLARENFTRDEQLWKDGIIAESRYRAAQSQFVEASAALAERKQMLHLAGMTPGMIAQLKSGENLGSLLQITAPLDGVILEKSVDAGQRVDSAAPLFSVAKLSPLGLEIQAPLAFTQDLREGAEVTIPAYNAKGKITAIGHSLSAGNQTILLRALIYKGTQNLRPGQHVDVSIATRNGKAAQWNVPKAAIARVDGKSLVFVQTAAGFRTAEVKVLHEGAQQILISGNLQGSEKIAVSGVAALKARLMGIGAE